jgi:hypothetical protein
MRKSQIFNLICYIRRPLVIYNFAPDPFWISLYLHRENFLSFFYKCPRFFCCRVIWVYPVSGSISANVPALHREERGREGRERAVSNDIFRLNEGVAFPDCEPLAEDSAAKLKRSQLNVCTVYSFPPCCWNLCQIGRQLLSVVDNSKVWGKLFGLAKLSSPYHYTTLAVSAEVGRGWHPIRRKEKEWPIERVRK